MENFKNFNFLWVVDVGDKKIHDGCKDCMSLYGRCDEAEKLFNDKYVLSPFLPFSGSREASNWRYMEKPLNFPLKCFHNDRYHHCGFTVYGCEHCDITYEAIDAPMYDYYGEDCPICGSSPEFLAQKNLYYNKYYLEPLYCHNCEIVYSERYNIVDHFVQYNNKCPHCGELGDYLCRIVDEMYYPRPQVQIEMDEEDLETMYYTYHPYFVNEEDWVDEWTEDIFKNAHMSESDIKEALTLVESIYVDK